jgi:hypothetical protein
MLLVTKDFFGLTHVSWQPTCTLWREGNVYGLYRGIKWLTGLRIEYVHTLRTTIASHRPPSVLTFCPGA